MPPTIKGRIAPTPSGYLHTGNLYSFVLTWLLIRIKGGRLLLRIDDLDLDRVRTAYLEDIFEILDWLGLEPDEGPSDIQDFLSHYSQKHRLPIYESMLYRLVNLNQVYACHCSRRQIHLASPKGIYPGTCRYLGLPLHAPTVAWRIAFHLPSGLMTFNDGIMGPVALMVSHNAGDVVVRRRDGMPAYQITSLADDLGMGINLIVRGQDLMSSTGVQLTIAEMLQENRFLLTKFYHHPLLVDEVGEKLSKSKKAPTVREAKAQGLTLPIWLQSAAHWLGVTGFKGQTLKHLLEAAKEIPDFPKLGH